MPSFNMLTSIETRKIINATVAGTTDVGSLVVPTAGYDSVLFTVGLGTLTAGQVTTIEAYGATLADGSDSFALGGTSVGPAADGDGTKMLQLEIIRPQTAYLVLLVDRATSNAVIDFAIAQLGGMARKQPIVQGSTNSANKQVQSPVAGTP